MKSGILYVVGSPIGTLGDLSFRAIDILSSVDLIAAEDTRVSSKILKKYSINKKCISYHDKNENIKFEKLLKLLKEGNNIALLSDAGTPCLSDPGYRIVNSARKNNINVITIPGTSSIKAPNETILVTFPSKVSPTSGSFTSALIKLNALSR